MSERTVVTAGTSSQECRDALNLAHHFSALGILVAPLVGIAFLVPTLLSPCRLPRLALVGATLMEVAVSAHGALVWFLPLPSNKS